jgi:molybdenum cofactor biosynthesis enzyme MoaA
MSLLDARIDLDTRCNYHCIYCQNHKIVSKDQPWFSLDNMNVVIPILGRYCWSIFLSCGGEPLLHPEFQGALDIVNKYLTGKDVVIVTNGFALDDIKASAILKSCISRIHLSVHTVKPDNYARLYGCRDDDFFRVKKNIEHLIEARGKKKWPKILVTSIAMKSTIDGLPDVAKWCSETGIDGMRIQWLEPFDTEGMDLEVIENNNSVIEKLYETQRILNKHNAFMEWPYSFGINKIMSIIRSSSVICNKYDYFISLAGKFLISIKRNRCRLAGYSFRVMNNGDIKFCHRNAIAMPNLVDNPSVNLHHIFQNAVKSLNCVTNDKCLCCPFL